MKCISCGNLIPDGSTICPYCNAKIETPKVETPVYNATNNAVPNAANVNNVSSIPETPKAPVLPQDQGMSLNPLPEEPSMAPQVGEVPPIPKAPEPSSAPNPMATQPAMPTPDEVTPPTPEPAPVKTDINPNNNPFIPASEGAPMVLSNQGEIVDTGTKIASAAPVKEKKSSKKVLLILFVVILLAILIGGGVYAYFYEFKSGDQRIDRVVNGLLSFTSSIRNETLETGSGSYNVALNIGANEESYTINLDGKYAIDLPNKMMDYTVNVNSLNFGTELLPQPLNVELYLYDAKAYVLLQNFFSKYIYMDIEEYDKLFDGIEQNDIDYQLIINMFKIALKSGIKASNYTQTIEDINIGPYKEKANVVRIKLDQANKRQIVTSFLNSLKNNKRGLEELAKIDNSSEEKIKEEIQKALDELDIPDEDNNITIDIYTKLVGEGFRGIKAENTETKAAILLYPQGNGYKLETKEDGKNILNLTYSKTSKKSKETTDNTYKVEAVYYDSDVAYNIGLELQQSKDINPKIEKVNVRESVNVQYLTTDDLQQIMNNLANYGELGMILAQQMETLFPTSNSETEIGTIPDISYEFSTDEGSLY